MRHSASTAHSFASRARAAAGPRPPARPRLVVRIGVTGHRPNRLASLDQALARTSFGRAFAAVRDAAERARLEHPSAYADAPVAVRVMSSLAEGADRLAAEVALAAGYELNAILPFPAEEFERDFGDVTSVETFHQLLAQSRATMELDGTHADAVAAYEEASRMVLRQCDVLVALWDGEPGAGTGGTAHTVERGIALGTPVVWIHSAPPHELRVLANPEVPPRETRPLDAIAQYIDRLVRPPGANRDPVPSAYYSLRLPGRRPWGLFRRVRALFLAGAPPSPPQAPLAGDDAILADYRWADRFAIDFADKYRDTFTANYLLAAVAVFLAAYGFMHHPGAAVGELLVIGTILWITWSGKRGLWHENWLTYRLLGEQCRSMLFLRPLGCAAPRFHAGAHATEAYSEFRWASWLFQARAREAPMIAARFDGEYRLAARAQLDAAIQEQVAFHRSAATRQSHTHHRIHAAGISLFAATVAVCVVHVFLDRAAILAWLQRLPAPPQSERGADAWLGLCAATFPAFGASLAGIDNHAEFARVAQRSASMAASLQALRDELTALGDSPSRVLRQIGERAAEMMVSELLDWQLIFWGKSIVLPT